MLDDNSGLIFKSKFISEFISVKTPRQYIDELLKLETIKVWSLIVTLFGDLGREEPVSLAGKDIRYLLGHIGIKPEAIRVALHRLKKDGWIVSNKVGRQSIYRLSENGILQTRLAYKDVYREDVKYDAGWKLQLQMDDTCDEHLPKLQVFKNVVWVPCGVDQSQSTTMEVTIDIDNVPDWFLERTIPNNIKVTAENYLSATKQLSTSLKSFDEQDRAAIRLLALHHWRKMALRDNTWLHIWLFKNGVFAQCHSAICSLLKG
ncbi:hypothetical protein [Lentilitoribacter sp. EG35]|jgi:phenylacetic acid degradation operon negative regulatory protein|uniref:hypothetical protein n=1 Tax=Lentilitoribacter sp. EG35 TaxID=3234192 RepID=UPI00346081BF